MRNRQLRPWRGATRSHVVDLLKLPAFDQGRIARTVFPKVCSCGRKYTVKQWNRLPGGELWKMDWGEILEQRHCVCGSTMTVQIAEGEPEE